MLVRDLSPSERRRYLDALYRAFEGGGAIVEPWVMSEEEFEESKTVIGGLAYPAWKHGVVLYANP